MFNKLVLASLILLVFHGAYGQVSVSTDGGTTGGAISNSPISSSTSSVGSLSTGASTSQGGAGGLGGTSNAITGASTSQGGSVGSLSTGASTSAGGAGGSVGSLSTGASTSTGGSSSVGNTTTGASVSAGGKSSSSGNTSGNTTITSNYAAPKIPVNTAVAPSNFPTAPCMGSSSIGGSAVLFGFSAGSSWEATECMTFEAARSFDQAGMHEDALAIKCTSKYSAAAPSCIKLKYEEQKAQQQLGQLPQFDQPKSVNLNLINGVYSETIDPVTGFKTIIDTRDSHGRRAITQY